MSAARVRLLVALALPLGAGGPAFGNGAFPDGEAILLASDRPQEMLVATNFGLVVSEDAGARWSWLCEREPDARLYALSAGRLLAVARRGLVFSDDRGCSWGVAVWPGGDIGVLDAFPDPTNPARVLVTAYLREGGSASGASPAVLASDDGGLTLSRLLLRLPPVAEPTGVESARSDPAVIYVTWTEGGRPFIARSGDGGASFATRELTARAGPARPAIIAVAPDDPQRLLLRITSEEGEGGDHVALSTDGGESARVVATIPRGRFTAFLRRSDGSLRLAGVAQGPPGPDTPLGERTRPVGFRSDDDGASFLPWSPGIRARALAERDGTLLAVADHLADGFALGASDDDGVSWRPLLRYTDVSGVVPCGWPACNADCLARAQATLWDPRVCAPAAAPAAPDGAAEPAPGRSQGCRCGAAGARRDPGALMLIVLAALVIRVVTAAFARRNTPRQGTLPGFPA